MNQRTYVGSGWQKKFDNGGSITSISINLQKLTSLPVDNYGNIRLVVGERRAPDEKSKATHWVAVDDYYYSRNQQQGSQPREFNEPKPSRNFNDAPLPDDADALPF